MLIWVGTHCLYVCEDLSPIQSIHEFIGQVKRLLYCLPLSAVHEVGDRALLYEMNPGEPRRMEAIHATFLKQFQFSPLLTCLVRSDLFRYFSDIFWT